MRHTDTILGSIRKRGDAEMVCATDTVLVTGSALMKQKYPNGLQAVMEQRGFGQRALARASGVSQQQINKLANGEREMTAIWAERLAPTLSVSPESLVFPDLRRVRAPVLSFVSAGRIAQQEGVRKSDVISYILLDGLPKGDWIVLEVTGDSMDRIAPDGSRICVNRANQRPVNDAFFIFTTAEGEATFKRYREGKPPRLQPYSTNPDHETLQMRDGMEIFGRVGRVIHDL